MAKGCNRMMLVIVDDKRQLGLSFLNLLGSSTMYQPQSFLCHHCLLSAFFSCLFLLATPSPEYQRKLPPGLVQIKNIYGNSTS
jgi:hypothetical protein